MMVLFIVMFYIFNAELFHFVVVRYLQSLIFWFKATWFFVKIPFNMFLMLASLTLLQQASELLALSLSVAMLFTS